MSNSNQFDEGPVSSPYYVHVPPGKAPSMEELLAEKIWSLMTKEALIAGSVGINWPWKLLDEGIKRKMVGIASEILGREEGKEETKGDGSSKYD